MRYTALVAVPLVFAEEDDHSEETTAASTEETSCKWDADDDTKCRLNRSKGCDVVKGLDVGGDVLNKMIKSVCCDMHEEKAACEGETILGCKWLEMSTGDSTTAAATTAAATTVAATTAAATTAAATTAAATTAAATTAAATTAAATTAAATTAAATTAATTAAATTVATTAAPTTAATTAAAGARRLDNHAGAEGRCEADINWETAVTEAEAGSFLHYMGPDGACGKIAVEADCTAHKPEGKELAVCKWNTSSEKCHFDGDEGGKAFFPEVVALMDAADAGCEGNTTEETCKAATVDTGSAFGAVPAVMTAVAALVALVY